MDRAVARSSFRSLNCLDVENAAVDGSHASQNCAGEIPVSIERHRDPQANLCRRKFLAPVPSSRIQARPRQEGICHGAVPKQGTREVARVRPLSGQKRTLEPRDVYPFMILSN